MWFTPCGVCRWSPDCRFAGCDCFVLAEDRLSMIWEKMNCVSSSSSSSFSSSSQAPPSSWSWTLVVCVLLGLEGEEGRKRWLCARQLRWRGLLKRILCRTRLDLMCRRPVLWFACRPRRRRPSNDGANRLWPRFRCSDTGRSLVPVARWHRGEESTRGPQARKGPDEGSTPALEGWNRSSSATVGGPCEEAQKKRKLSERPDDMEPTPSVELAVLGVRQKDGDADANWSSTLGALPLKKSGFAHVMRPR